MRFVNREDPVQSFSPANDHPVNDTQEIQT